MVVVGSMISTFFAPWLSTHQGTAVLCLLTRMIMKALWGYKKQLTLSLTNEADKKCENRDGKLQTLEATISSGWKIIPTVKISIYHFSYITKYQSRALFRVSGFFIEQHQEFENFEAQESLHRTKHKILQLVAQSHSFLSSSGLKSWDWLCDLIDGLEVLSSQSSWLDSSRYSSSDNFSQLCYGFQAEIPSSHAISSCTNQEHKNHSP